MDLLENFKNHLLLQKFSKVTIRNYLSDLRHFFSWLELTLRSKNLLLSKDEEKTILTYFQEENLLKYKKFLLDNRLPLSTINRRLSTLRTFGDFCLLQGLIPENPARQITNVSQEKTNGEQKEAVLDKFKNFLSKEKTSGGRLTSSNTIKNYLSDIREFLGWLEIIEG